MNRAPAYTPLSRDDEARVVLGIKTERNGTKFTVRVSPKLIATNAKPFRDVVQDALDEGARELVLDLSQCADISSHGLGALVSVANRAKRVGGSVAITGLTRDLRKLMEIVDIARLFTLDQPTPEDL